MRASDQSVEKARVFPTACVILAVREFDPLSSEITLEKHRIGPIGTADAVNLNPSVASSPARRWGGTRNSASRTSDSLSLHQAANIAEAAQFAAAAGMPFNRHLTIHWQQAGIPDERAAWATGRFLKLASDWVAKRGNCDGKIGSNSGRFAWAWARENDGVSGSLSRARKKGSHVHILMHLPTGTRIGTMQRRWLRSITGRPYSASTIKTARIGGTAGAAEAAPAAYQANLAAVVDYILKGASPTAARALGLDRLESGGRVIGKRGATSQNIGRAARRRDSLK
ncbi:MAG TPA: hypothetical protein VM308_05665 [Sphingomicrobium sp.]|nr:hypothetical protein [Sphingomicrobium sp.]